MDNIELMKLRRLHNLLMTGPRHIADIAKHLGYTELGAREAIDDLRRAIGVNGVHVLQAQFNGQRKTFGFNPNWRPNAAYFARIGEPNRKD